MASTLADILVTLTLDTEDFSKRLRDAGQELQNFKNHVKQVSQQMERDWDSSMRNMGGSLGNLTSTTTTTTNIIQQNMNNLSETINNAGDSTTDLSDTVGDASNSMNNNLNSVARSSRYLARTLGTSVIDSFNVLSAGTREFREFGQAGRRVSQEIRDEFSGLPRHLQMYVQRLREAGQNTDAFARLNEQYSARLIEAMRRSNDYMQNRTSQSMRLLQSMRDNTNLAPLTSQFLQLGDRLEQTARRGSALNLALQRIGPTASMKDLQDQMKLITQGVGRARGAFLVFGIASLLAVGGMIKLASAVDDRVAPAFERMKKNLIDAFEPFIHSFATGLVAVMNFVSGIAKMINKFSEAHPVLFNMIMYIMLLTLVFGTLLAPLAVTGVMAEGVAASFAVLWASISPFVLGFLAVIGVALALAGAFVVLWVSIQNLWKHSEAFRNAFINLWNRIKQVIVAEVVQPVMQAWERLKVAFSNLIANFTGGAGTMGNLWKFLGDRIAIVVNGIANVVLPVLKTAFDVLGQVIVAVINAVINVMNWLGQVWKQHGDQISTVASQIWTVVQFAFQQIANFIKQILPQVKQVVFDTFNMIKAIIDFTMKYIAPIVVGAFKIIWNIIKFVMPVIVALIVSTWNNIKQVITSTINIIQNVIQLFSNILKGNWKGAWENVKAILKNAVTLIWNLIQLYFLGKLLAPFKGFISAGKGIITGGFKGFLSIIKGSMTAVKTFIVMVWQAIVGALRNNFTTLVNTARTAFTTLKSNVTSVFNGIKSTATTVWNGIKNAIVNPIETAKKTVLGIIKAIAKAFAGIDIKIPKPSIPKLSVSWTTIGKGKASVKVPKISWNAKGNIFNGASILGGNQGVGEAGAEAVMPIQHKRYMKPFAGAVAHHLGNMMGGNTTEKTAGNSQYVIQFNEPVVIREDADIQRIVDELERRKRISERAKGVFSY
jgi:phage-related protein